MLKFLVNSDIKFCLLKKILELSGGKTQNLNLKKLSNKLCTAITVKFLYHP